MLNTEQWWFSRGTKTCLICAEEGQTSVLPQLQPSGDKPGFLRFLGGGEEDSLSEAAAVDLGDGVGGHGAADPRAGRRALGHGRDAVGGVLTGRGQGGVTGPTQTVLCRQANRSR